jgi:hypothetical protein
VTTPVTQMLGTRIAAALGTLFNVLVLNLVLLIAALPVVTIPAALGAASVALDRWRGEGEDRVVVEFVGALRSGRAARDTVVFGVPLAAIILGLAEAHHFARGTGIADRAGLGFVLGALLITLSGFGYVLHVAASDPGLPPADVWSLSARLAVRNLLVTGLLSVAELAVAAAAAVIDPGLLLLGLPLLLLYVIKRTAGLGIRRVSSG